MKAIILFVLYFLLSVICPKLIPTALAQWVLQGTVTGAGTYPDISVYSPTGIVVAGGTTASPKVFKSTNSGVNWTDISGNLSGTELGCVWAVDSNLIFAGDVGAPGYLGGNAKVWKTTNGGINWSVILSTGGTQGYFNGIAFSRTDSMIGIALSDPPTPADSFYLAKTTDGGSSWLTQTTISTGGTGAFGTVICVDNLYYGWGTYGSQRKVVFTTDGGTTWNIKDVGLPGTFVSGFAFSSDKTTGLAVSNTSLPTISRSTDGGLSWATLNTGLTLFSNLVGGAAWVYGTNNCYLTGEVGTSGCVGKSTDGGATWTIMNTAGIASLFDIELIYSGGTVDAYAINRNDKVIKLEEPIGIIPINSNVPSEYRLEQNYPNPFNPVTKITFSISPSRGARGVTVQLVVYDALGRVISILNDEQLNPGTYEVYWDASNNPSGVYYYRLTTGDFTETRKMILIK